MSIKHDNVVPNVWPEAEDTTGFPVARIGRTLGDVVTGAGITEAVGEARVLGARATALTEVTGNDLAARPVTVTRILINEQHPKITLPPPPVFQIPGNANSTDYACGVTPGGARTKAEDPFVAPVVQPPAVKVAILNLYASNSSLPLGYDPQAPVTELLVNTDFYINLRIRPSVGLAGYDPTVFTMSSVIGGTEYGAGAGFAGWSAGDGASNWLGSVYRIPGSYLGATGVATLTVSAGQVTVNSEFGHATTTVNVIPAVTTVTAAVEQTGWYTGVVTGNIDTVYQGQTLQLVVNGPPSSSYTYFTPWATGTSTTDANGQDTVTGTALQAGTFEFTVSFVGIAPYTKPFQVLNGATDYPGDAGGFTTDSTDSVGDDAGDDGGEGDGDGVGGDGDGGDGDGGGTGGGGDGGGDGGSE